MAIVLDMKTTRIAANKMGNKMTVQLASRGVPGALDELRVRVNVVRAACHGGNGAVRKLGWPVWLWNDAKTVLAEQGW